MVKSHTGIIAIIIGFIPHKYHNLRALLDLVKDGNIPQSEATAEMKAKWATQIRQCVGRLHELGIIWGDIKTDNVIIDENGDAVILDFGGGNTQGWVDEEMYGTGEGDLQGLDKIMKTLGQE